MPNATIIKDIGHVTALGVISEKAKKEYPVESMGASTYVGVNFDETRLHFSGSPDLTEANNILSAIEKPTCSISGLVGRP